MRKILLLAAAGLFATAPAQAADVTILGCDERLPGRVGVRDVVADVGDTVQVAVTVSTVADVDAFGLDVAFPANLLRHVRTEPGELVAGWSIAQGALAPAPGVVRITGRNGTPVPGGVTGRLAVLVFVVEAAGSGTFTSGGYGGDFAGYAPCEEAHTPLKIERRTWGAVKELYR